MNRIHKYYAIGICLFLYSFIFRFVLLPVIVKRETRKQVEIRPNKFMRQQWIHYPFTFDYNIYMFNITNPDEVMKGEKPVVQEVGPFVYDEIREKTNLIDNDEDDTVAFTMKNTLFFNTEKSNGLTGEEEIIVPNYFIVGLATIVKLEKPTLMPAIGKGIDSLFNKPSSIFMKAKVKNLLFDGFLINCTVKDFAGSAICGEIKDQYEDLRLKKIEEGVYLMSMFGTTNGTASKYHYRVERGYKHMMKLGNVVEYNNKPNISLWNDEICDRFNGTEGTIFHPFRKDGDPLSLFNEDLCRNVNLQHVGYSKYKGIKSYTYSASLGTDVENIPEDKCYCMTPDTCPKRGAYDAYKCFHVPIIVTNPHFLGADPYYFSLIDGLSPDKEKHTLKVELDPLSGVPMHAHSRAQLNMFITKMEKFKLIKNIPDALLPLLWFDEVLNLPDFLMKPIKDGYKGLMLAKITFFGTIMASIGMFCYAAFLQFYKSKQSEKTEIVQIQQNGRSVSSQNTVPLNVSKLKAAPVPPNIG